MFTRLLTLLLACMTCSWCSIIHHLHKKHRRERYDVNPGTMSLYHRQCCYHVNADRVLRATPKPSPESTIPRADEIEVGSYQQNELPQTPVTPVTADVFMSLYNLIKQDTYTLNETSIPRLHYRGICRSLPMPAKDLLSIMPFLMKKINS